MFLRPCNQLLPGQLCFGQSGPALVHVADVEIDFRGRDAGMTHERLQGINVQPGLQHPCGERVPQGMPDHPVARIGDTIIEAELVHDAPHGPVEAIGITPSAVRPGKKKTCLEPSQTFAQHVEAFGIETPRSKDARFPSLRGAQTVFGPYQYADRPAVGIAAFASQVDQLSGPQARVQREKHHVMQFAIFLAPPTKGQQLCDLRVAQDTQSAAVCLGQDDGAVAAAQDSRIRAAEQHGAWRSGSRRLQGKIEDLAHCLEDVQDGLGRQAGAGRIFVAPGEGSFGGHDPAQIRHVLRRDVLGGHISKNRQYVHLQDLAYLSAAGSILKAPASVMLCQFTESQPFDSCPAGQLGLALLLLLRHGPHLTQALRALSCADVLLQLPQQGDGLGDRPSFTGPAQRLMDALSLSSSVTDGKAAVRSTAMLPRRMLPEQYPFFSGDRLPSVFVTHLSPTLLDSKGSYGQTIEGVILKNQGIKYSWATLGISPDFLLSSRPQVRFLPGAPQ